MTHEIIKPLEIKRPFSLEFRLPPNPNRRVVIDRKVILGSCRKNSISNVLVFVTADSGLSVNSQKRIEERGWTTTPHAPGRITTLGVKVTDSFPHLWIGLDYLELEYKGKADKDFLFKASSPHPIGMQDVEHYGDFGTLLEKWF